MQALVVDDSRTLRRILGGYLQELGFDVREAGNGREALESLEAGGRPDIVLVDWNMPEMNGLEFVRVIRARSDFQDLPLMMVTTETDVVHIAAALTAGANEYVMKPFTKEAITDKLQLLGLL